MRCDAHEIAELVVVVDGVAIGTLLVHVCGIVLEQRGALLHRGRVRPLSSHDRCMDDVGESGRCPVGKRNPCKSK